MAANREVMITAAADPVSGIRSRVGGTRHAGGCGGAGCSRPLYGETVAEVNQGVRRYEMGGAAARMSGNGSSRSWTCNCAAGGAIVRLREVADIGPEKTSNLITRENACSGRR